jgi:hypothetical protein
VEISETLLEVFSGRLSLVAKSMEFTNFVQEIDQLGKLEQEQITALELAKHMNEELQKAWQLGCFCHF